MLMIDADYLKPLVDEVERTRAEWERSINDPTAELCSGSANFHMALYDLAGAVKGLIEAAEPPAAPVRLH
jgi:hypothetical protein